jgi:hypothetical protein
MRGNKESGRYFPGFTMKKPQPQNVEKYALSIGFRINGEQFCNYYESKGWLIGKSPMKSWEAAVRTWKQRADPKDLIIDHTEEDRRRMEEKKRELEALREREWEKRSK